MTTTARAFTWNPVEEDALSSNDLRNMALYGTEAEAQTDEDVRWHTVMMCGSVTIADEPQRGEFAVIYMDGGTRIGLAWGGDADWGDFRCDSGNDTPKFAAELEQCIGEYLNDWDAWSSRN